MEDLSNAQRSIQTVEIDALYILDRAIEPSDRFLAERIIDLFAIFLEQFSDNLVFSAREKVSDTME